MSPLTTGSLRAAARAAALSTLVASTACGGPTRHADGEGPVASLNDPEGWTRMAVEPTPGVEAWSFGMFLCMREPGTSAVLQGVVPHETIGSGVEEVGIVVHEVTFSSGEAGTISTDKFPPAEAADVVAVDGYVLTIECVPSGPEEVAEVVVGLGLSGDDGGGWLGADVTYTVGDRDYVLEINNEMLICGEAAALFCDQPVSLSSE